MSGRNDERGQSRPDNVTSLAAARERAAARAKPAGGRGGGQPARPSGTRKELLFGAVLIAMAAGAIVAFVVPWLRAAGMIAG